MTRAQISFRPSKRNHSPGLDLSAVSAAGASPTSSSQAAAHTSPTIPATTNTQRQPDTAIIAAIAGGAKTAPTAVPALITPIAVERSRTENHSATAFVAAGNPPPSPIPNKN